MTIDLPEAQEIFGGPEVGASSMLIGLIDWQGEASNRRGIYRTCVVDLADGSVRELQAGSIPLLGRWGVWSSPGSWNPEAMAGRLLWARDGTVSVWHPDTDEIEQILPLSD